MHGSCRADGYSMLSAGYHPLIVRVSNRSIDNVRNTDTRCGSAATPSPMFLVSQTCYQCLPTLIACAFLPASSRGALALGAGNEGYSPWRTRLSRLDAGWVSKSDGGDSRRYAVTEDRCARAKSDTDVSLSGVRSRTCKSLSRSVEQIFGLVWHPCFLASQSFAAAGRRRITARGIKTLDAIDVTEETAIRSRRHAQ